MPLNLSTKFTDNIYILHCDGAIVLGPEATSLETLIGGKMKQRLMSQMGGGRRFVR
jgi:hypothetical protein